MTLYSSLKELARLRSYTKTGVRATKSNKGRSRPWSPPTPRPLPLSGDWKATFLGEENSPTALNLHLSNLAMELLPAGLRPRTKPPSTETGYILLIFGSGFFTDVPGEVLGTLAGPPRPWVLGEPEGPLAGDSYVQNQPKSHTDINIIENIYSKNEDILLKSNFHSLGRRAGRTWVFDPSSVLF